MSAAAKACCNRVRPVLHPEASAFEIGRVGGTRAEDSTLKCSCVAWLARYKDFVYLVESTDSDTRLL